MAPQYIYIYIHILHNIEIELVLYDMIECMPIFEIYSMSPGSQDLCSWWGGSLSTTRRLKNETRVTQMRVVAL